MPPQKRRGPYKKYLRDQNARLSRTTCWLRQQQEREINDNVRTAELVQEFKPDNTKDIDINSVQSSTDQTQDTDNNSVRSAMDEDVQPCKGIYQSSASDSDSSDDEGNDSDPSSISSSESKEGLWRNEIIETSDDDRHDIVGNDSCISDNENDLRFGVRGNLIPDVLDWTNSHNEENQARVRQPLYEGAQISKEESDILIMSFIVRWGLEEKGIEHLLRLLDCHMPTALLGSKYSFLKKFETGPSMKMRYFCHECSDMLPTEDGRGYTECACGFQGNVKDLRKDVNCFVHLPISEQLKQMLSNQDLVRQMRKETAESDVVSGKVYKRLRSKGVIRKDDITLQWNTDGLKPFKSSKVTIWPIQACVNELPSLARRNNMLLCGLYYGVTKPDVNVILAPFVDELRTLHSVGINCNIAGRGERLVKVHTLLCCVDSVVRASLEGIMQSNGRYGCSFCLRRGTRVERARGSARVFTGSNADLLRTSEQHLLALKTLENYNETHVRPRTHVQGVKRGTVLLLLPVFNIIKSFVPDYLHCALEGTVVTFWKHWCSSEYEGQQWHLSQAKRKLLNERLQAIMPPVEVSRVPRSLDDIALWKASEMRSFLLYYSLPCLKDLLPNRYLRHWLLFVYSMTVFSREKIDRDNFLKAQQAIVKFVEKIEVLYPNCQSLYTYNTHLLLHFPKAVENFGGLWASCTFPYEHFNGVLTRLINKTQGAPMQICCSLARLRHVSHLSLIVFSREDCSHVGKLLYQSMLSKYASSYSHLNSDGLRLFGSPENYELSLVEKIAVERHLGRVIEISAKSYGRMIFRETVFHSSVYGSLSMRDNSLAKMNDGVLVSISRILLVKVCNSLEIFCVILCNLLQSLSNEICWDSDLDVSSSQIIHVCRRSEGIVSFTPQNIQCKCVGVPYGNAICVIPVLKLRTERD